MYDYIIVGGGPTGLSLGHVLGTNGLKVAIIEKDKQLGGSWNSQWIEEKYWSENSPRIFIYSNISRNFMFDIGLTDSDFVNVYGNIIESNLKKLNSVYSNFNLVDCLLFLSFIIKYKIIKTDLTLDTFLKKTNMSKKSKKFLKIVCITLCDRPDKTNINNFVNSLPVTVTANIKQMKQPNKWHKNIEKNKNITFFKNTKVIEVLEKKNHVYGVITDSYGTIHGNKVVLSTQSDGLMNILKNSNFNVKNNWKKYFNMDNWLKSTYYSGFGFQLHFNEQVTFPKKWCWSCYGDWTIIILPVSNWLSKYTKDLNVKTVWSCCIVDMDTKSKRTLKTPNESTRNEVLNESLQQINDFYKIPKPYKITTSEGLKKVNNKWVSKNTGFTKSNSGYLPIKGNIENLYALGCFTENYDDVVSYFGKAIESSIKYLDIYEPSLNGFHNKPNYFVYVLFVLVIIFLIYINGRKIS